MVPGLSLRGERWRQTEASHSMQVPGPVSCEAPLTQPGHPVASVGICQLSGAWPRRWPCAVPVQPQPRVSGTRSPGTWPPPLAPGLPSAHPLGLHSLGHKVVLVHGAHPLADGGAGLGHLGDGGRLELLIVDVRLDGFDHRLPNVVLGMETTGLGPLPREDREDSGGWGDTLLLPLCPGRLGNKHDPERLARRGTSVSQDFKEYNQIFPSSRSDNTQFSSVQSLSRVRLFATP